MDLVVHNDLWQKKRVVVVVGRHEEPHQLKARSYEEERDPLVVAEEVWVLLLSHKDLMEGALIAAG